MLFHLGKSMKPHKLPNHERIAALLVIAVFMSLSFWNIFSFERNTPLAIEELPRKGEPLVQVTITGAVQEPGVYQVKKGTAVSQVIEMARPLDTANLGRMRLDSKILRKRKIVIRERIEKN